MAVENIGSRRELFVDDHLLDEVKELRFELHRPIPREISFSVDADDVSSNVSCYAGILQNGADSYRMYYRAGCWAVGLRD